MHLLMNGNSFTLLRFLVFLLLLANIGCQKEISSETGALPGGGGGGGTVGGSAQFALVPSGNSCSDADVEGTFVAGTAVGMDAEIIVTVNVTKTGDWTYSTSLVNGFAFAGAGTFTTTGNQIISLMAVGKPIAAGTSKFNLNIGGATCYVNVPVVNTGGSGTLSTFYYKATIDGVNYVQDVTASNGYEPGVSLSGQDDVVFGGGIIYSTQLPAGKTEFAIEKGVMHGYQSATQAQFKAFFPVGNVSYAPASFSTGDGVKVYWTDAAGESWETRDGPVDQTGSTFKIVSVQDYTDAGQNFYVIATVQFSCKLYNSAGAMKPLTNGEAVVPFGMF
jgi:hypothetical protein